jgi:AcrR family transcriptional regulator
MKQDYRDDTRQRIVDAAWELFHENGYEKTTVNDIIKKANTSKGGFYYYFSAKDELLNALYPIFDREYQTFYNNMDKSLDCYVQLQQVCQYAYYFTETHVSPELLARLYQAQLLDKSQDSFMSPDRYYVKMIKKILTEGQERHQIRDDISVDELAHMILVMDRGVLMDWCIQNGKFSLGYYGSWSFELYMQFIRAKEK